MIEIGSYSTGTLRHQDIISDILPLLEREDPESAKAIREDNTDYFERTEKYECLEDYEGVSSEDLLQWDEIGNDLLDTIYELLEEFVPDFCYFGGRSDDPADVGCWVSNDAVDMEVEHGNILVVEARPNEKEAELPSYLLLQDRDGSETLLSIIVTETKWSTR